MFAHDRVSLTERISEESAAVERECRFTLLRIGHLRNIAALEIEPEGFNLIVGPNGSGKSSILEGIYLLVRGHSFRERSLNPIVMRGCEKVNLFGRLIRDGRRIDLGVEKSPEGTLLKRNGENVRRLSEIAQEAPLLIHTPQSVDILDREPEQRRRLVDWGVFHVEHSYRETASRYQRALSQRNAALKSRLSRDAAIWEEELASSGERMEKARIGFVGELLGQFTTLIQDKGLLADVSFHWQQGWALDEPLQKTLARTRERDLERGFTQLGPHRSDIVFSCGNALARRVLSRGQKKLLLFFLQMAQAAIIVKKHQCSPVLLLDDISSELDAVSRGRIAKCLEDYPGQRFVTALSADPLFLSASPRMFHVEHGCLVR